MRLFTGIGIPPEVTGTLLGVMETVRHLPGLRFVAAEKLHLDLKAALATVPALGPIEIRLGRLGWMPHARFPRTLYAGVFSTEALQQLAHATTQAAESIGVQPERRAYHPHVTLARVNGRPKLSAAPNPEVGEIGAFQAHSFFLYLSADGKYTRLQEFSLFKS